MGFNKIPLALKFDDATGNSTGLKEFTLNLSDVGDVCTTAPTQGQLLGYDGDKWCVTSISTGASVTGVPTGNLGQIVTYASLNTPQALSPTATPLNLATTGIVETQIQDSLVGYATTAFTDAKYNTTATFYSTTATLLEKPSAGSSGDILLYANNNDTNTTSVAAFIADQDLVVDSDLNAYATTAFTDSRYNTTATFYATTATLATNANLAATAAAAVQVADTTADSRAFIATDADLEDLTNVAFNDATKPQVLIRTGSKITASSLNEGAINTLFQTDGEGDGSIDFTPSSSGGGSTLISENVSATNLSAINGTVTTAPTTGNHVANKTYVDGINNTQHNRLFAVGTKTSSIANTTVYLGWEFDVVSALSVSDSGGVITLGGSQNTEITFGEAGDYMIDCTVRANADNRIELFCRAEYYDATTESPTFVSYNRLQNSNYAARDIDQNTGGTTLSLLLSLNQNDKLRFEAEADADGTCVLLVNGTFLRIVKLA